MGVVAVIDALSFLDSIRFHGHGTVFSMKFEVETARIAKRRAITFVATPEWSFSSTTVGALRCFFFATCIRARRVWFQMLWSWSMMEFLIETAGIAENFVIWRAPPQGSGGGRTVAAYRLHACRC